MKIKKIKPIKNDLFGVKFEQRGPDDKHIMARLLIEDDTNWHETDVSFSSFWIDDLIAVLQRAKAKLEQSANKEESGYGWEFKL